MGNGYLEKLLSRIDGKPEGYQPNLKGISGSLFIFVVFCILKVLISIVNVVGHIGYLGTPEMIVYAVLMLIYLSVNIGLTITVIWYVFKKDIVFRKVFVVDSLIVIVSMAAAFIYSILVREYTAASSATLSIVFAALWTFYLYKSKRVKNTFIYPHTEYAKQAMGKIRKLGE